MKQGEGSNAQFGCVVEKHLRAPRLQRESACDEGRGASCCRLPRHEEQVMVN